MGALESAPLAVLESGYRASERLLSQPAHLLAFNNLHHREQLHRLPPLLGVRANANMSSHQARIPRVGQRTMTGGTSMGGTFSYMSPLTSPTFIPPPWLLSAVLRHGFPVVPGQAILAMGATETK